MSATRGNPAPPDSVVKVFDRIAPIYDLMNTVMTVGIDRHWRSAAVRSVRIATGMRVLDIACGTGVLTRSLAVGAGPTGEVVGVDRSEPMLARALARAPRAGSAPIAYRLADALTLPFPDASFDAVTVAFGLRNLPDYGAALAEMARVARPGARVVVLEIAEPPGGLGRILFRSWFRRAIPILGRLAGNAAAYSYLPASLATYPAPADVAGLMRAAGLERVRWRLLATGMATLHAGVAPARAPAGD
ncbi:MAG TPA: ubiquinone/menaquinone biosynthesis methyltransferase [Candidatus Limnocylindria bacterium]|nr:ubiquinone/menaquinone biosynthesis methyltransferase [Candidatus Limnocylindria bacterium]